MGEPLPRRRRQELPGALTENSRVVRVHDVLADRVQPWTEALIQDSRVVRVLPDEPAIDREFDYLADADLPIGVGDVVRIDLGPRRVRGWVIEVDPDTPPDVQLRAIRRHGGRGPSPELIELADWASRRYAGRRAQFLRTATPPRQVHQLYDVRVPAPDTGPESEAGVDPAAVAVVRLAPAHPRIEPVLAAMEAGPTLIVVPEAADADVLVARLRRDRRRVARWPEEWARAVAGCEAIVGTRAAAWARVDDLAAIVVVDEHDESLRSESRPNWNARDVLIERGRRLGVPVTLTSPAPSLEALAHGEPQAPDRLTERSGWAPIEVIDRRLDRPGPGSLFSDRLVELVRTDAHVVCVLNRKGRSQLLRCKACDTIVACHQCGSAVEQPDDDLVCRNCGATRPPVCLLCGATRLVRLRPGVSRVAEELAVLARRPVTEITGTTPDDALGGGLVVGTEAALHRLRRCDVVVLLDADQELLAPRFRAREQALWLLARASRLVGGRRRNGRVLVQTRMPDHPVIAAAVAGNPELLADTERAQRRLLELPPFTALARLTGDGLDGVVDALTGIDGVAALGPDVDGAILLRADDHDRLSEAAAALAGSAVKIEVDPIRI